MQSDVTLYNCPFRGPLYIHKNSPREQLLHNNHKFGSRPKDFNKNKYTSKNTCPTQAKFARPRPKMNSVQFDDPYDRINPTENTHEYTHLIGIQ